MTQIHNEDRDTYIEQIREKIESIGFEHASLAELKAFAMALQRGEQNSAETAETMPSLSATGRQAEQERGTQPTTNDAGCTCQSADNIGARPPKEQADALVTEYLRGGLEAAQDMVANSDINGAVAETTLDVLTDRDRNGWVTVITNKTDEYDEGDLEEKSLDELATIGREVLKPDTSANYAAQRGARATPSDTSTESFPALSANARQAEMEGGD